LRLAALERGCGRVHRRHDRAAAVGRDADLAGADRDRGSLGFSVFLITTRMLRGASDVVMVGGQFAAMLVVSAIMAPFGWVVPTARDFGLMMILGVVAMAAFACVNRSLKLAPASVVVPYQYTMIVWAVALGFLVFGDVPDAFTLLGSLIIIRGGTLYFLARGRW